MAITIEGVPEFITRDDYLALMAAVGFDPKSCQELRFASDGIHAIVFYFDEKGERVLDHTPRRKSSGGGGFYKHRVFIPVRDDDSDTRTTRTRLMEDHSRD